MIKNLLAAAGAFALLTTGALAETATSSTSTTTNTTVVPTPSTDSYSSTKSEKTLDSNGTVVDKTRTYNSGSSGTSVTSKTKVEGADGSKESVSHEKTIAPDGSTTSTSKSSSQSNN